MDDAMAVEAGNCVVATAWFGEHAVAGGKGASPRGGSPCAVASCTVVLEVRCGTGTKADHGGCRPRPMWRISMRGRPAWP